jgi:hypothetical protein
MITFEYKVLAVPLPAMQQALDEHGPLGWDLVAATPISMSPSPMMPMQPQPALFCVFKRPGAGHKPLPGGLLGAKGLEN